LRKSRDQRGPHQTKEGGGFKQANQGKGKRCNPEPVLLAGRKKEGEQKQKGGGPIANLKKRSKKGKRS